jgi:hypothetical protein
MASAIGRRVLWGMSPSGGGPRDGGPSAYLQFPFFVFLLPDPLFKGNAKMRAIDLVEATTVAWERLSPLQRDRFFRAFVSATLRLDRVAMRDWLRKRLRNRPLAAPVDLTRFAISDADMAALLEQLPFRADATTTEL